MSGACERSRCGARSAPTTETAPTPAHAAEGSRIVTAEALGLWSNRSQMDRHDPRTLTHARVTARVVGALVGMLAGIFYGLFIISNIGGVLQTQNNALLALIMIGVAGAASFALAAPLVTIEPFLWLEDALDTASPQELLGSIVGLLIALTISALVAVMLSSLPWGIGFIGSALLACVLVYVGVKTGARRRSLVTDILQGMPARGGALHSLDEPLVPQDGLPIVVDTSVLIDGRIADVVQTGFIQGRLIIAGFVLEELQRVADSGDPTRRMRGRRGLAIVQQLKDGNDVTCDIVDLDFPGTPEVDSRLIKLARVRQAALMTNDFNLNRLAKIEGVRVLNLNELANALKPVAASGEELVVQVVKEGREPNQGVGYLDDGTMVVVEGGRAFLTQKVSVKVTSVLQTPAGRMIFAVVPPSSSTDAGANDEPKADPRGTGDGPGPNPTTVTGS